MKLQAGSAEPATEVTPVKGGWIKREAATGRLMEAQGAAGIAKASHRSETAVKAASSKRREALKRLADR